MVDKLHLAVFVSTLLAIASVSLSEQISSIPRDLFLLVGFGALVFAISGTLVAVKRQLSAARSSTPVESADDQRGWPCPTCGYDLRSMPERCPECGNRPPSHRRPLDPAKLREDWPHSPLVPRVPSAGETLLHAWDAPNGMAADLLVEQFRARGITAVIKQNRPSILVGSYQPPAIEYAVFVWSDDAEAVEGVLRRLARDDLDPAPG